MVNNIISLKSNKYELKLSNFEGPLDLLVYLIDKHKMNIYDISIVDITDQYLSYLNSQEELNLEITSEFLIMASTLLLLKSKKLLPKETDDESELTEEELIKRILEYKRYKEVMPLFRDKIQVFSKRYYKIPDRIELKKLELQDEYNKEDIIKAYKKIISSNNEKRNENAKNLDKIAIVDRFSVSEKAKEIFGELIDKNDFIFNKKYSIDEKSKEEVVTALSSALELGRREKINIDQEEIFGDITISRIRNQNYDTSNMENLITSFESNNDGNI